MLSGAAQHAAHTESSVLLGAAGLLLTLLLLAGLLISRRLRLAELGDTCRDQLMGQPAAVRGTAATAHEWLGGGEDSSSEPDEQLVGRLMSGGSGTGGRPTPPWLPPTAPPPAGIGYERPSLYRQFSLQPFSSEPRPRLVHRVCRLPATNGELSAAERGKMGEGTSSSCSSTTSGEDELGSSLRRRDCRRCRQLAGRARSLDSSPPPGGRQPTVSQLQPTPDPGLCERSRSDMGPPAADAAGRPLGPLHQLTYTIENVPKCRKPIVVRRHVLSRQSATVTPPSPASSPRLRDPQRSAPQTTDPLRSSPRISDLQRSSPQTMLFLSSRRAITSSRSQPQLRELPGSELHAGSQLRQPNGIGQHNGQRSRQANGPQKQANGRLRVNSGPLKEPNGHACRPDEPDRVIGDQTPHSERPVPEVRYPEGRRAVRRQLPPVPGTSSPPPSRPPTPRVDSLLSTVPGPVSPRSPCAALGSPRPTVYRRSLRSRRRLLPATPQSSVESAPAALGRPSPSPDFDRLAASSTPCLALGDTDRAPRQQYFRYSHLLIFPLQYFGSGGLLDWTAPADGSSSTEGHWQSPPPSPPPPGSARPRERSRQRIGEQSRERSRKLSREQSRDRSRERSREQSREQSRRPRPLQPTNSLPTVLSTELEHNPGGVQGAPTRQASLEVAGATRQPRPSLGGYDPYDPFRPVRHKRVKPPPKEKKKTKSRSLLSMEWRILKALEPRAFQPPLRAWRSGIDITTSEPSLVKIERLSESEQADSGSVGWLAGCGELEVACAYDAPTKKLTVQVLQAKDVPSRDRGGASNTQVRLVLLPGKKQRLRSRMQPGETPQFNEAFVFNKVDPDELRSTAVRLRLYGCERLRRERMIGEAILPCSGANVDQQTPVWISLQPRANMTLATGGSTGDTSSLCRSDSTSSTQSIHRGGVPELLLGLQYSATTGRLAAEVIKGSHFRASSGGRAPDTYVRLHLLSSNGRELARSKTSVRRGQPNPLYKETFMFQIPLFQLSDVTLMVSVYNKRNMKKRDLIGWFGLGHNSSGEEERSHWSDARDARGVQICRWHLLCEE